MSPRSKYAFARAFLSVALPPPAFTFASSFSIFASSAFVSTPSGCSLALAAVEGWAGPVPCADEIGGTLVCVGGAGALAVVPFVLAGAFALLVVAAGLQATATTTA